MLITGYSKRSIATQTGDFGYNLSVSLSNTTGQCLISFSGLNNNLLTLNFQSGKIYDNNNRYIYSYESNNPVILQGFINPVTHNLYANGVPIEFSGLRPTGYVNYMVVNPINCTTNFNFSLSGFAPSFSIPYINFGTTGITGTGYIINEDVTNTYLFRFFNGSGSGQANYSLLSLPTGNITGTGTFLVQRNYNLLPISQLTNFTDYQSFSFETNFGDYQQVIPINYSFPIIQQLTSNIPGIISSGAPNYGYIYWNNLVGEAPYTGILSGQITVSFISGSGFNIPTGNPFVIQTGNLDGTQMVTLPYNAAISGYQSNIFPTSGNSGVMISFIQNAGFTITGANLLNYSGYNTGINALIQSPPWLISQYLSSSLVTGLAGSGSTGSNYIYWTNVFGPVFDPGFITDTLVVSWISGASSGNFSGAFTVKTGYLNSGNMQTVAYSSAITGYKANYPAFGPSSGMLLNIIQNSGFSSPNILSVAFYELSNHSIITSGNISGSN